jgi:cytochrome c553
MRSAARILATLFGGAAGLAPSLVAAQAPATPDLLHGQTVAAQGNEQGAAACASCHGLTGIADGSGAFPRLTGQSAWYLYKQLKDYAGGTRENAIMGPIAKVLSEADMQDVAAYYEQTQGPYFSPEASDPTLMQWGGTLSAIGSEQKHVQACVNCHGPAGAGMPPSYPYLAGQFASYTQLQFQEWKLGNRRNDPLAVMRTIAAAMDDRDIAAVAQYFDSVRPVPVADGAPLVGTSVPPPSGAPSPSTQNR